LFVFIYPHGFLFVRKHFLTSDNALGTRWIHNNIRRCTRMRQPAETRFGRRPCNGNILELRISDLVRERFKCHVLFVPRFRAVKWRLHRHFRNLVATGLERIILYIFMYNLTPSCYPNFTSSFLLSPYLFFFFSFLSPFISFLLFSLCFALYSFILSSALFHSPWLVFIFHPLLSLILPLCCVVVNFLHHRKYLRYSAHILLWH
jgi:hypothetical protein